MALPRYRAKRQSFIHDRLVYKGDEFAYEGIPSRHWQPLNKEAEEMAKKIKDSRSKRLDESREARRIERAAKEKSEQPLGKQKDEDPNDDGEGGEDETKVNPADLTPTQKAKAITDALAKLKHDDDAHWTQGGEPNLNVLKELIGFAVKRVDVKEVAPEFVREQ